MPNMVRIIHSKVIIFFLFSVSVFLFPGCKNNDNDVIPYVYVDFTIDLNDPMFSDLNGVGNTVVITSNAIGQSVGYNNHGVLIYRASETEFYAFDRTCTFEEAKDQSVTITDAGDMIAECPHCHSQYILPSNGYPTDKGPARYPLKQYKTFFDGRFVRVHN